MIPTCRDPHPKRPICAVRFVPRAMYATSIALPIALLLFASIARADSVTYTILSNPQSDVLDMGYTLDVSGTITISNPSGSPFGDYNHTNDSAITIASTLTMSSNPAGLSEGPISEAAQSLQYVLNAGDLIATPTGLSVESNTNLYLLNGNGPYVHVEWNMLSGSGVYYGEASPINSPPINMQFGNNDADQYLVAGEWEIAAVPEPSTVVLFASAIVALGLIQLRRQRKLA